MDQSMRRRTQVSLLIAACGALACADEEPQLCDGSDEVRWAAHDDFGAREWVPPFIAEYGSSGIRIDGHCQFWLYDTSLRGLRRGVIGAVLERSIMYWSNYGSYARYDNPSYEGGCGKKRGGRVGLGRHHHVGRLRQPGGAIRLETSAGERQLRAWRAQ